MPEYGVILFHTTSECFRTEKVLKNAGITCKLIPVPRELSSDCGTSARFDWAQRDKIINALESADIETAGIRHLLNP